MQCYSPKRRLIGRIYNQKHQVLINFLNLPFPNLPSKMKGFLSSKDIIFCLRKHWLILKVIKCTRSSSPLLSSWPYPYNLEVRRDETKRSTCCKLLVLLKNKIYDLLSFLLPLILNMIWKTSPLNCLRQCKNVQHEVIRRWIIYFCAVQIYHVNELRFLDHLNFCVGLGTISFIFKWKVLLKISSKRCIWNQIIIRNLST